MSTTNTTTQKAKRPSNSAFRQQRLHAWQPILTAGAVLPAFFVLGVAFIPVGVALLFFSSTADEKAINYTFCQQYIEANRSYTPYTCYDVIRNHQKCSCRVEFELTKSFAGKVYIYYSLTNFYQNHRRYVKSRDDNQLLGYLGSPSSDCKPYDYVIVNDTEKIPIAPCGAVANSFFNDSFTIFSQRTDEPVPLIRKGIAWPTDREKRFRNPEGDLKEALKNYAKPPDWQKFIYELDPDDPENNGFQNEDFIVWMRTSALPDFRKLYRMVNHSAQGYALGLLEGNYTITIDYNYPMHAFGGEKYIIIATTSVLGGRNSFLGYAYIVGGVVCILLGLVFLGIHIKYGKTSSEFIRVNSLTPY